MNKPETVAGYLDRLTFREQLILCNCIREHIDDQRYAHLTPALLPFVRTEVAWLALEHSKARRPIAVLLAKFNVEKTYKQRLWLQNRKVAKVFSGSSARGRRFNWLPTRYHDGKPIDKLVCLRLSSYADYKSGSSQYDVIVHDLYKTAVMAWLVDNLT
jgi:hypothetical protein